MKNVTLCSHIIIPAAQASTETFGFLGKKGGGKTYAAQKLFEQLFYFGTQCVALDPVGNWWGLRVGADGKSAGLAIPVFGGPKGDIPLEATAGAFIAQVVVKRGISVILDVSRFRKGERKRFATDFAEEFFQLKKDHVSPVHLFVEESHVFVPQRVQKGEERMLGAMEDLVRIGRNYGIGCSLISQRAASVNKDVLTQVECLFAFQTSSAQDKKALKDWVEENESEGLSLLAQLRVLQKGDALFWSPSFLRIFRRVHIDHKDTFDASATPTAGSKPVKPQHLAQVDLDQIRDAMKETIAHAEENDVTALKAKVRNLEAQLAKKPVHRPQDILPSIDPVQVKRIEALVAKLQKLTLEPAIERLDRVRDRLAQAQQAVIAESHNLRTMFTQTQAPIVRMPSMTVVPGQKPLKVEMVKTRPERETKLRAGAFQMLQYLAAWAAEGLTRRQLATFVGIKSTGTTFSSYLSNIRVADFIVERGDCLVITAKGLEHVGNDRLERPTTTQELVTLWSRSLRLGAVQMLEHLVAVYPHAVGRDALAAHVNISENGTTFSSYLSNLRANGLVDDVDRIHVKASADLFP